MPLVRFTVLTLAGCIPWVLALGLVGQAVGSDWKSVKNGLAYVDYAVVVVVVLAVIYLIFRRRGRGGSGEPAADAAG
jgi:membrane protein DedA with SNARE-associated domain